MNIKSRMRREKQSSEQKLIEVNYSISLFNFSLIIDNMSVYSKKKMRDCKLFDARHQLKTIHQSEVPLEVSIAKRQERFGGGFSLRGVW